ncbi:MAG: uroporphyrinogen decarboxylase [Chloroflexota bacterium]|nr:uroporphyrinogen decarboxylase [Chloroflexota bacterium]
MNNRRDAVLSLLDASKAPEYVPAAFFLHFDPQYQRGQAAVEKHMEFFRHTGMDFVKIQFELPFPRHPEIRRPEDWDKLPVYGKEFYEPQLAVVEGLVRAAKREALVVLTLYSPFMLAGQAVGAETVEAHIRENPEAARRGIGRIAESLLIFVRECIRLGVDGFYHSTQGGEASRLGGTGLFEQCVKPFDLLVMNEINRSCIFNILHICDYHAAYADLTPFLDYPGHVVNCSLHVGERALTPQVVSDLFGRPFMGGLERKGILATGTPEEASGAALAALRQKSARFILGADCTVPGVTSWDNLRAAVETAHSYR